MRLFARAESVGVQTAIAGILLRSDYAAKNNLAVVQTLREHRLKSAAGEDMIDILIRRLQGTEPVAAMQPDAYARPSRHGSRTGPLLRIHPVAGSRSAAQTRL